MPSRFRWWNMQIASGGQNLDREGRGGHGFGEPIGFAGQADLRQNLYHLHLHYSPKMVCKDIGISANRSDFGSGGIFNQFAQEVFQFFK